MFMNKEFSYFWTATYTYFLSQTIIYIEFVKLLNKTRFDSLKLPNDRNKQGRIFYLSPLYFVKSAGF